MKIRTIESGDIEAVAALETRVWGAAGATPDQVASRAAVFPAGSLIAELEPDTVAGYVVVQRVDYISTGSWSEQTDDGRIAATHRPQGRLLYGVNLSVAPEGASRGVSQALIEHCYRAFVTSGACAAICLGSRLPGFARWSERNGNDIRRYLAPDAGGLIRDPELRIYQRNKFRFLWPLENYFEDPASLNYGAMIVRN